MIYSLLVQLVVKSINKGEGTRAEDLLLWSPALVVLCTGFSSEIGTKLRDWAVGQAGGSCYSRAALSSKDSETLY